MNIAESSDHSFKRLASFYNFVLVVFLLLPHYVVSGIFLYPLFLLLSIYFIVFRSRVTQGEIIFLLPLLLMFVVVMVSHAKSVFILGLPVSLNDFSDYFKFVLPVLLFLSVVFLLNRGGYRSVLIAMRTVVLFYCFLFVAYFLFGNEFLYAVGLGRGFEEFYRYGGVDINPNAYAAISVSLIVVSLACFKRRLFVMLVVTILFLSLIYSQSRTNIIAFSLIAVIYIFLLKGYFLSKVVLFFFLGGIVFLSLNYLDLYWLTAPDRFNFVEDRSFNARIDRSLGPLADYIDNVGLFGVGPGRSFLDRLDTISYVLYFVRYGVLGLLFFLVIHFWFSFYFFYNIFFGVYKGYIRSSRFYFFMLGLAIFPYYVLISSISNEKWMDLKFVTIWFLMMALGYFFVESAKLGKSVMR